MVPEVLVHISTPATRQNDDLFRSLADSYLNFEPRTRYSHQTPQRSAGRSLSSSSCLTNVLAPAQIPHKRPAVETSILSTSKESYGSFPSHISSGGQEDVGTGSIGDGSVPTSSRLARLDRIHMRWKGQVNPGSSSIKGQRQSESNSRAPREVDTAFIEDTQLGAQALQSQLQDSYSTTDEDTSEGEVEPIVPLCEGPSVHNSSNSTSSIRSEVVNSATSIVLTSLHEIRSVLHTQRSIVNQIIEVQTPAQKELSVVSTEVDVHDQVVFGLEKTLDSSQPTRQPPRKKRKVLNNIDCSDAHNFSKLCFDAFPPAPKVSIEHPGRLPTQITNHLAAIKAQNPKRFRYSKKHRTPKADERGYWSISCSDWPASLQHEFWTLLHEHVSSGRLGWGTTLHREASSTHSLGQVRLYTWAEVAEHIWLMLWLCSKGQIVGSKTKWIDAGGAAVFEML
ncbi:hypothetical protein CC86DRAFT_138514 [Ophiobolus disseminans]|uniref:Uncharacterized protein n=1 Tax=Ophiobolus disseminans TaxID=1469910 RepID=A0A6A7AFC3_9PLEO|nr:hypothetical protein CC86DRAFT_138514 [Ophiobolus disseminans]